MPNWCSNSVTLRHADPAMIVRARDAFNRGEFLDEFVPVPPSLREVIAGSYGANDERQALLEAAEQANLDNHGYKNWYDFCVGEWGTKWDVGGDGCDPVQEDGRLTLTFDSAWAPPCAAYEKLIEQGFEVEAFYYEPGMAFVGKWDNGEDDCYDYSGQDSNSVRDYIGEELDDHFGISADMADYEEENAQEDADN